MSNYEPPNEYLRIVDPLTKGVIYCVHKIHLTKSWCDQNLLAKNVPLLDATNTVPFTSESLFVHKSFPGCDKVNQSIIPRIIDFACLIDFHLRQSLNVVVYCKNGSRSPTAILAFLMLRGIRREHALHWLFNAFRSQRPTFATNSTEFSKIVKFAQITIVLEKKILDQEENTTIQNRVRKNLLILSKSNSSAPFSCLNRPSLDPSLHLCGIRWIGPYGAVPPALKMMLPKSSFCSSPTDVTVQSSDIKSKPTPLTPIQVWAIKQMRLKSKSSSLFRFCSQSVV